MSGLESYLYIRSTTYNTVRLVVNLTWRLTSADTRLPRGESVCRDSEERPVSVYTPYLNSRTFFW
jgi:hypothetical protein